MKNKCNHCGTEQGPFYEYALFLGGPRRLLCKECNQMYVQEQDALHKKYFAKQKNPSKASVEDKKHKGEMKNENTDR